jgi:hypothetical protein
VPTKAQVWRGRKKRFAPLPRLGRRRPPPQSFSEYLERARLVPRFRRLYAIGHARNLVTYLNGYERARRAGTLQAASSSHAEAEAWMLVIDALTRRPRGHPECLPPDVEAPLNRLAVEQRYWRLFSARPGQPARAFIRPDDGAGVSLPVQVLWGAIEAGALGRVKRCRRAVCGRWFVDETRSNTKAGCTPTCTWMFNNTKHRVRR